MLDLFDCLGTNAIRALDGLGVLEAVLARSEEPRPTKRPFKIIAGVGNHEHIFDVSSACVPNWYHILKITQVRRFCDGFRIGNLQVDLYPIGILFETGFLTVAIVGLLSWRHLCL